MLTLYRVHQNPAEDRNRVSARALFSRAGAAPLLILPESFRKGGLIWGRLLRFPDRRDQARITLRSLALVASAKEFIL